MVLLQQMLVLFCYMLIGYVACKKGKLDETASSKFSWVVLNISNPMLIISSAVNNEGEIRGMELLMTAGIAVAMFAILMVLAEVIPVLLKVPKEDVPFYKLMTVFSNMSFMGFPVISAVYGTGALLYAAVFTLPFNLLIYTYGIQVVDKNRKGTFEWRKILNIGVISCVVAAILYLGEIPVPQLVKSVSQGLGHLNAPLSMMVTGIALTQIPLRELFTDLRLLLFAGIKLLLIPVIGLLCLKQFIDNEILLGVCMVIMSTPVASMTVMLAKEKCEDCGTIVKGISLTTILSVVTIPIVSAFVDRL